MEMSFHAKTRHLPHIQNLVKRFDGRFRGNPYTYGSSLKSWMVVGFTDMDKANKFSRFVCILNQPFA